jgi:4-hydroxy-tetrahydrodipicolinate synthase
MSKRLPKARGIIVPLATPFSPDGEIDVAAVRRIIERFALHGLSAFVLGTTGEASSISPRKRSDLVAAAVSAAQGRVPVYAGIADNCTESCIAAANAFLGMGVNAVVALPPGYYPLRPSELRDYFELLAREIGGDLLLYNIPQTTHLSIPLDVVEALSERPNVVGFKDSESTLNRPEQAYARLGGRPDFSLFMGSAMVAAKAMRMGFDGVVPSSGNIDPVLWRDFWSASLAGDWPRVEKLQIRQNEVTSLFQRNRILGESLAALKALMEIQGLCSRTMLSPIQAMDDPACAQLRLDLAAAGLA